MPKEESAIRLILRSFPTRQKGMMCFQQLLNTIFNSHGMFPFAFEKQPIEQPQTRMDEASLLSCLFLTMLQNERLSQQLTNTQSEEVSFSIKPSFNREQEYQLQIELKQVKIDNLTSMLRELQGQVVAAEKQLQEALHRSATLEMNTKHEASELKTQVLHYRAKYEEESGNGKKMAKVESQFKKSKTELQGRNKELSTRISQLQNQLLKYEKGQELQASQHEKRAKQLRIQVDLLRSDLTSKQQQCFSLRSSLDDCPKIEQLNRWISKVKEYEQKQMQACSKMSQMSQELCTCREKLRRLENEHRELLKVKQELETTLTENKGHEDSMVIYFDRLQTYQKVIKELEEEIRKLQTERKNDDRQHQAKLQALQNEKEAVVAQWKAIADQMAKQKTILATLQKQVDKYQDYIAEQNQRQKQLIRNEQASQISLQKAQQQQRMHALQEERRRLQEMRYQPYSLVENSKCSERSNRSFSLQNRRNDLKSETDSESIPPMHSQLHSEMSSQLRTGPASHSGIGRAVSEQRIVYHSDSQVHNQARSRNSTSRMNTQSSTGCGQCMSRVCETSNRSMALQERPLSQYRNEGVAIITDEKKLLMEKLNILKPDPSSGIRAQRSISTLYSKSYRQANPTSQNFLKISGNQKQAPQQTPSTSHRLQLGRGREQKQNLNDMIVKRYANLMGRP